MSPQQYNHIAQVGGLIAWGAVAMSVLCGLLLSTRLLSARGVGGWGRDLHQFLSAFAVAATALHLVGVVLGPWAGESVETALWWMFAPAQPTGFNFGVPALHLLLAVTITSFFQRALTIPVWRMVHRLAFVVYVLTTVHLFTMSGAGTRPAIQWLAFGVSAAVVFLFTYRLVMPKAPPEPVAKISASVSDRRQPVDPVPLIVNARGGPATPAGGRPVTPVPVRTPVEAVAVTEAVAAEPAGEARVETPPMPKVARARGGTYRDPTVVLKVAPAAEEVKETTRIGQPSPPRPPVDARREPATQEAIAGTTQMVTLTTNTIQPPDTVKPLSTASPSDTASAPNTVSPSNTVGPFVPKSTGESDNEAMSVEEPIRRPQSSLSGAALFTPIDDGEPVEALPLIDEDDDNLAFGRGALDPAVTDGSPGPVRAG